MMLKLIVSFSLFVLQCNAGDPLSFIDACKILDNDCIFASTNKALPHLVPGVPEAGVPTLDPLEVGDVNGDNGDLKLKFKDLKVYGLGKCEIIKIARLTQFRAELIVECPISAKGQYEVGGKLFIIDVYGGGGVEIKTNKIRIEVAIDMQLEKGEDGEQYYKIKKFDYKYLPIEKFFFSFENLFNGDKAKAEPIEKILDEGWLELVNEIGRPVIEEIISRTVNIVGKVISKMPKKRFEIE